LICRDQAEKRIEDFIMKKQIVALTSVLALTGFAAADVTIDLTGLESWDNSGAADNVTGLGNGEIVYAVSWDNVVGNGDNTGVTWGNEMNMLILGEGGGLNLGFFPAEGGSTAGGIWGPASSGGVLDLGDNGIDDFVFETWELYESYDDVAGAADAHYDSGTVTLYTMPVPAPGALALLGVAGIAARRRRK
jgi:hypothetical protein